MKENYLYLILFLNVFFSFYQKIQAQSSNCATATVLTAGNAGAACSATTGILAGFANTTRCSRTSREGFYQFQATSTTHNVIVTGDNNFDAIISVGVSCASITSLTDCVDVTGNAGTETINLTGLTIGTFYFIAVRNFNTPGNNNANNNGFDICITTPITPPANDACGNAIALTQQTPGSCTTVSGSVSGATLLLAQCTGTGTTDVWYTFVATGTTAVVRRNANFDSVAEVFSGTCAGFTSIACQDLESDINLTGLTAGVTYYVRIYYFSTGIPANPTFTICVTTPLPPPVNDNCTGAITLTHQTFGNCVRSSGTITNATQSLAGCSGTATRDIWFQFVATSTIADVRLDWAELSPVIQVFRSSNNLCTGTLTSLICQTTGDNAVVTGLTIGDTYFVRVYPELGASSYPSFSICVTTTNTATNNLCGNPITLTHESANRCTQTAGTFTGTTQSLADCNGGLTTANDVWYNFVATATSALVHRVSSTQTNIQVFTPGSTCSVLTNLACHIGITADLQLAGLTIGQTYLLRIYPDSNTLPADPRFSICISTPATITNQACAAAAPICGTNNYSFQAITGGTAPAGNNYGCLTTRPAPAWFYFQVATTGNIVFGLESSDDVDFAVWGPYTSFTTATASCGAYPAPISCSYSSSNVENPTLGNAIVGEVYVMLITNFANINQVINLRQIGGSGGTACSIVLSNPLVMFKGENQMQNNILSWALQNTENMSFTEIVKSKNGKDFYPIGKIENFDQKNNNAVNSFVDNNVDCNMNYYKIRNYQKDGVMTESNTIQIIRQDDVCNKNLKIYPNPASEILYLHLESQNISAINYKILDLSGKTLQNGITNFKEQKAEITISELPKGVFLLESITDGKIQRQKFIKN